MIFARKDEYGRTPRQAAEDAALRQAAAEAAMNLRRWSLNQALAWISTRSPEAVGLGEGPLFISIWCDETPGNYPFPEVGDAWRALAEAMAEGEIHGLGMRAAMTREGGLVSYTQGVRFPPEDQLGAALSYRVFDEDDPAGVLAPDERPFAQAWREFRDVTFKRDVVMALFPAPTFGSDVDQIVSSPERQPTAIGDRKRSTPRADYARELIDRAFGSNPPKPGEGKPAELYRAVLSEIQMGDKRPAPSLATVMRRLGWR